MCATPAGSFTGPSAPKAWASSSEDNHTYNRDAVAIADGITNVVFDHCTFAWSLDEIAQGYYAYDNITFNRCIFAEPLYIATHLDEGTFSPNRLKQAESLAPFATSGLPTGTNPPPYETVANPVRFDGARLPLQAPPPRLGEHDAAIRAELSVPSKRG